MGGLFRSIGVVAFTCMMSACARAQPAPTPAAASASCPMAAAMHDSASSVEDTENGVAITFTAPEAKVDQLRAAVRSMASSTGCPCMGGRGMAMGRAGAPPSNASVEDIPGGARLILTPTDPSQLAALRAHVRQHQAQMQSCMGGCCR